MRSVIAWTLSAAYGFLAALHVYWAIRGVSGGSAVPTRPDATPVMRPGRVSTLAVAVALTAAAIVVLGRAGLAFASWPAPLFQAGAWGLSGVFAARAIGEFRYVGFFKRVRGTRFATLDTWVFSPISVALAAGTAIVASR